MRKTVTPCIISKTENGKHMARYPEYPDINPITFDDIEFLLDVSSIYLAVYMIANDKEFEAHKAPLTPPDDLKPDEIFSLVMSDISDILGILIDEDISPSELLSWIKDGEQNTITEKDKETTDIKPVEIVTGSDTDEFLMEFGSESEALNEPAIINNEEAKDVSSGVLSNNSTEAENTDKNTEETKNENRQEHTSNIRDVVKHNIEEDEKAKSVFVTPENEVDIGFEKKKENTSGSNKPQNSQKRQPPKKKPYYNKNKNKNNYNNSKKGSAN